MIYRTIRYHCSICIFQDEAFFCRPSQCQTCGLQVHHRLADVGKKGLWMEAMANTSKIDFWTPQNSTLENGSPFHPQTHRNRGCVPILHWNLELWEEAYILSPSWRTVERLQVSTVLTYWSLQLGESHIWNISTSATGCQGHPLAAVF